MMEITVIMLVASLMLGAAVMLYRKPGFGAYVLTVAISVLAIGAAFSDSTIDPEGLELTIAIVAPFVVFLYGIFGMLFLKDNRSGRRWLFASVPRTFSASRRI